MKRQSKQITALYCRIASCHAEINEQDAEKQMDWVFQYANEHRLPNPEFFCDWGFHGLNGNRPAYQRMLHKIEAGEVSDLVVSGLSRLGRDSIAICKLIGCTLPRYHVRLHAIKDGLLQQGMANEMADVWRSSYERFQMERKGGRK